MPKKLLHLADAHVLQLTYQDTELQVSHHAAPEVSEDALLTWLGSGSILGFTCSDLQPLKGDIMQETPVDNSPVKDTKANLC